MKPMQFAIACPAGAAASPARSRSTLPVPLTYDFEVATAKYFHGLEDGEIPLLLLFSGTIFVKGETGLLGRAGPLAQGGRLPPPGGRLAGSDGHRTSPTAAGSGCGATPSTPSSGTSPGLTLPSGTRPSPCCSARRNRTTRGWHESRRRPPDRGHGRQRDEIHSRIGNSSAIGRTVVQGSIGNAIAMTLMTTSNASAVRPSIVSLGLGGSRAAEASPITSGAIVTMPSASEANQFCQVLKAEVVSPCNKTNPRVPPIPETAAATAAAPSRPRTWRNRSRLKGQPK